MQATTLEKEFYFTFIYWKDTHFIVSLGRLWQVPITKGYKNENAQNYYQRINTAVDCRLLNFSAGHEYDQ